MVPLTLEVDKPPAAALQEPIRPGFEDERRKFGTLQVNDEVQIGFGKGIFANILVVWVR
jgi:hypothetical protein